MEPSHHSLSHKLVLKLAPLDESKLNVVLVTLGSFSPIHFNHINMLNAAKNHLESRGDTHVVGAFISPTADKFLHKKLLKNKNPADFRHKHPPNFISGIDRCNMVELMVKDSDWIMCDRYEAENNASATEGKKEIQQIVSQFYGHEVSDRPHPGALLSILNVSGIDAMENIKSEYSVATVLFVVNRQQDDGKDPHEIVANHPHGAKADVVWDSEWESRDISSSMLRKLWAEGKDVSHITSPDVIQYMKDRNITFAV